MQLWSALTQQFQQIAASAMKEASKATAVDLTKNLAKGVARGMATQAEKAVNLQQLHQQRSGLQPKKLQRRQHPQTVLNVACGASVNHLVPFPGLVS